MNTHVRREYNRLRAKGWTAQYALRAARAKDAWDDKENEGLVKLDIEPEFETLETFEPDWSSMYPRECDVQRAQKEWRERVMRDGLWILVTSWRVSEDDPWESADSCGGFVGDDWQHSGYDTDLKLAALDALAEEQERRAAIAADCLAERATLAGMP